MLARPHRFHGLGSLTYAYKRGAVVRGAHFSVRYRANQRRQTYRVAVVVSKKVAKSAVTRNRIRRRIFEAVRLCAIPETHNYDVILSVYNHAIVDTPITELTAQVRDQFRRAGII